MKPKSDNLVSLSQLTIVFFVIAGITFGLISNPTVGRFVLKNLGAYIAKTQPSEKHYPVGDFDAGL